ncbi:MAG: Stk1 family PASTA domain-containing Ser/Thr kinase [Actinobacteria bacterium]|nr:Stk1 family PASTA domain-containing Ser/Thr kinase [Actinomycetota bacterium]
MIGKVLNNRYELRALIGSGGMADVYRASDNLLGRPVAVKILHPQYAKDPIFIERFRQEAQAAANLNQPNIVNVYDWGIEGDIYFLVMEYVEGRDLKDIILEGGPLLPERTVEIALAICSALDAAHAQGIVHRDIKPQNIIITKDNQVKVMDFGIARAPGGAAMTQTGTIMGTAQYISPEQAQGRPADPRSDLYSIGIVLYEMLTGKTPFDGENPVAIAYKQVREDPLPPSMTNPDISPELEAVVMKSLSKNPENRYQSALEMRSDLERCLEGAPVNATPILPAEESGAGATRTYPAAGRGSISKAWIYIAVAVFMALVMGIGVWAIVRGSGGVEVPNVVGMTVEEAEQLLEQDGFKMEIAKQVIDAEQEPGTVISQDPQAGDSMNKGGTVKVVASKTPDLASVPDCRGMSQSEAEAQLLAAGFELGEVTEAYSQSVEKGLVASQSPEAGLQAARETPVNLVISKGPEMVSVPGVTGLTQEEATAQLQEKGLTAEIQEEESGETEGTVIGQNPAEGTSVPKGSTVVITVAAKPDNVEVPNVVGKTQSAAESTLINAGFQVTVIEKQTTVSTDVGKVIDQSPAGGQTAEKGSKVVIYVGSAP